MKQRILLISVLFLVTLVTAADDPLITITQPSGGYALYKNETETIRWTHSDYFDAHAQTCRVFCGSYMISPPVPVTADSFVWTVSRKADGTYLPQGVYKITIESPDYDALNGPTVVVSDEHPLITITAPVDGASLVRGSTYTIRWTHSSYFHVVPQTCRIFCGDHIVSPPVPVLNDEWIWQVGKKEDNTFLPVGDYEITLESPDHDSLNGPDITIILGMTLKKPIFKLHPKYKIPLHKVPDCPMCVKIDPRDLKIDPQAFEKPVTAEIVHGQRIFAKLGKFGRGLALPAPVIVKLDEQTLKFLKGRQSGIMLHIISAEGKVIQRQPVQLELNR